MGTFHEDGVRDGLKDVASAEPRLIPFLFEMQERIQNGFYGPSIVVDAIFQERRQPSIEQVYAFSLIWSELQSGTIAIVYVGVDGEPSADIERERNQTTLNTIHPFFSAKVTPQHGGSADNDGILKWMQPINVEDVTHKIWPIKPRGIPLEIGHTKASRTFAHLARSGAVARWPYGYREIVVFMKTIKGRLFS